MRSSTIRSRLILTVTAVSVCTLAHGVTAPVLDVYGSSLTANPPVASNNPGKLSMAPRFDQRGTDIDGTLRVPVPMRWAVAADAVGGGYASGRMLGDVNLSTGSYQPTEIDLALPSLGLPVVIGRTYNNLQQDGSGTRTDYNSPQGWNWVQTAQPQIKLVAGGTNDLDVLYIAYGNDRFIEFKRIGLNATEFKSKNGAAGAVAFTAGDGSTPELYTYYDQRGNTIVFFGFNAAAGDGKGQLWKMTDPQGHMAYVHDSGSAATAAAGYTSGLVQTMYDASGRAYVFSYTTVGGLDKLSTVQAQVYAGSWTTVAQVTYAYYTTDESGKGLTGDLKGVTITHKGVSGGDYVRRKYYRYYTGNSWADSDGSRGKAHSLKLVVGFDGVRQYDPSGETYFSESDANLKPYSEAYFQYVSGSDYRLRDATFNGDCGCGGGSSGVYFFSYADGSSYSTQIANATYDTAWARRTVVLQPDGNYVSQYFDETGAVLARVLTNGDPSASPTKKWVTDVVRNSSGQVTSIHSPANITGYTHSTGSITQSSSVGLITVYARRSASDNLDGLRESVSVKQGTSGTSSMTSSISISDRQMTVGSTGVSIAKVDSSSTYPDGSALTTSYTHTYWNSTATDQAYLADKVIQTTYPTVTTGKNGSNAATNSYQYLRKDGSNAFTKDQGGILHYSGRTAYGQAKTQIADCNSATTGDMESEDLSGGANLWSASSSGSPIHAKTTMTYDDQGRLLSTTQPSYGSSGSTTRTSVNVYVLDSYRLGVMSFPRKVSTTYYGPARYTRVNHAGKVDRQTTIKIASAGTSSVPGTTASSTDWSGLVDTVYDLTGMRSAETRTYTTDHTTYDSAYRYYDSMGRTARVIDATATISRTVFDERGQVVERWVGTNDNGWTNPSGSVSGAGNMVKVEALEYDSGASAGGGNGHLTSRTLDEDGNWAGGTQRVTSYQYDYRGRAVVQLNPVAPHSVRKYDNSSRVTAVAQYSSTSGLSASTDPTATSASTRVTLNETFYNERGQVYQTKRHEIVQSGGTAGNKGGNQVTDHWYDDNGRLIKTYGAQITKTVYDRLGRVIDQFVIAKINDSSYSDADDVTGDIVMEQTHGALDPTTGRVLASWLVQRAHDDYTDGTSGALDTNADADTLKLTAANLPANARAQITSLWYDDNDRTSHSVRYGTNGGSDFNRSGLSVPSSSATTLKTSTVYDDFGRVWKVTDPNAIENRTEYDFAGRKSRTIDNYVDGTPGGGSNDEDRVVEYEYETAGRIAKAIRKMPNALDDQITTYFYGVTPSDTLASQITSNAALKEVLDPEGYSTFYSYNALSEVLATKDPAGNIITNSYDGLGRITLRDATTVGSFDSTVDKIETTYESRGMVSGVKQKNSGGTVLDEIAFTYDNWGNLASSTQDPDSAIGVSGRAEYAMTWTWAKNAVSGGWRNLYLTDWTQPDGASGMACGPTYSASGYEPDHFMKRTLRLSDDTATIADYVYLGVGTVVGTHQPESQMKMTFKFTESGSSSYNTYMDRFNRPILNRWRRDITGSVDPKVVELELAYDLAGNVSTVQDNILKDASGTRNFDQKNVYDDLRRLVERKEGELSGTSIATQSRIEYATRNLAGNIVTNQISLDSNATFADGTLTGKEAGEMADDRTYNKRNELIDRDYTDKAGSYTRTPSYDANGNMISDGETYDYTFNPWGQLVQIKLKGTATVAANFRYNGLGQRIAEQLDTSSSGSPGVADNVVDANDPWFYLAVDMQGRRVATFRNTDTYPKETFVYHQAGANGNGGAIGPAFANGGGVLVRARNSSLSDPTKWATETASDTRAQRTYSCSDFRGNVVALVDSSGKLVEQYRYSHTGVPYGIPLGDVDGDGTVNAGTTPTTDYTLVSGSYEFRKDLDLDGDVDVDDQLAVTANSGHCAGRGILSTPAVCNRFLATHRESIVLCHAIEISLKVVAINQVIETNINAIKYEDSNSNLFPDITSKVPSSETAIMTTQPGHSRCDGPCGWRINDCAITDIVIYPQTSACQGLVFDGDYGWIVGLVTGGCQPMVQLERDRCRDVANCSCNGKVTWDNPGQVPAERTQVYSSRVTKNCSYTVKFKRLERTGAFAGNCKQGDTLASLEPYFNSLQQDKAITR